MPSTFGRRLLSPLRHSPTLMLHIFILGWRLLSLLRHSLITRLLILNLG